MSLKSDSIVFLLGAGASVDAGLKSSANINNIIEKLIQNEWQEFKELYFCVKSGIFFKQGVSGKFTQDINVEILMDTLTELTKRHEHTLSPFIGSWIPRLAEINYKLIEEFKQAILEKLVKEWVSLDDKNKSKYYKKLEKFQKEFEYPLHLFSLNYDLCIEKTIDSSLLKRGFNTDNRYWDYDLYKKEDGNKEIKLYKMHGSIDWINDNGRVKEIDGVPNPNKCAIIFGTIYKLRYVDPFLFFINEFKNKLLNDVDLLVIIGYSYSDEHINAIIAQAFQHNNQLKILNVSPGNEIEKIKRKFPDIESERFMVESCNAKSFFENKLSIDYIKKKLNLQDPF